MTPARQAVALAAIVVLAYVFGVVLPRRTECLIDALRERIRVDPTVRWDFYLRYLRLTVVAVAGFAVTVALGGEGAGPAGAGWSRDATERLLPFLAASLAAALLVLAMAYAIGSRLDPAALDTANQYARVEFLVPHARRERTIWPLVCLAIAVIEECVYRGLFVLYAAALTGIDPWWLVLPVSVLFGLGHRYQGWLGVVGTAGLGLAFGIVTVGTHSLWPAIVLHAAFDVRLMYVKRPESPRSPDAPPLAP
jgi:membrane protease YdiL (CAAX protease family)